MSHSNPYRDDLLLTSFYFYFFRLVEHDAADGVKVIPGGELYSD